MENECIVILIDVFYIEGNIFTVESPATYSFKTKISEWYIKTVTVMLKDTMLDKMGDYVSLVE